MTSPVALSRSQVKSHMGLTALPRPQMGDVVQCQLSKSLQMRSASSPGNQVTASLSSLSKFSLSVVTASGGCSPLSSKVPDSKEAVRENYTCFCMRCCKAKEPVTPAAPPPAPMEFGGWGYPNLCSTDRNNVP